MKQYLNVVTAYMIMFTLIILVGILQSWSQALSILNYCFISAVMTIGANIQWGYAGLINFGIMGYTALGGLAVVLVSVAPVPEAWKAGQFQATVEQIINGLADNKDTENIEGYNNLWSKSKLKNAKEEALAYIAETMIQSVIDEGDTAKINQVKEMFENGRFKQVLTAEKHQALRNKLFGLSGAINKAERKKFEIKLEDNVVNIAENGVPTHEVTKEEFDHWYGKNNAQWVEYERQV